MDGHPLEYVYPNDSGQSPVRNLQKHCWSRHWLDATHLAAADNFDESFVARGEAILELIGKAMGRDLGSGHGVFMFALSSAGFADMYVEDQRRGGI